MYNGATEGDDYSNMEAVDTRVEFDSGTMKVVFLNKFVTDLLVSKTTNFGNKIKVFSVK